MNIRIATTQDRDDIRRVYLSAFPEGESGIVAELAMNLLCENSALPTISLIAETDGSVVGHVAFSPVGVENHENCQAYILAPLAVKSDYQKHRIGSALIEYGMQQLSAMGVDVVFVYGDPKYYGRFGFNTEVARNYKAPYRLQYPFGWQAIAIRECVAEKEPAAIHCVTSLRDPRLW
ncbi:MAG: N-acetyltransferase [Syntrophales bacterium]|nr:N-acetyltransferase [Syntrophales bacterium]